MSLESSPPRSRRAVLAAALGGLGAVVASRLAGPDAAAAADNDLVTVGNAFTGTVSTSITTSTAAIAFAGHSATGPGLWGSDDSTTIVDFTGASRQTGVIGISGNGAAMADNTGEVGVYGFSDLSDNSAGVWGDSGTGQGVYGTGFWGTYGSGFIGAYGIGRIGVHGDADGLSTGVYGFSGAAASPTPPAGVGVQATAGSVSQIALNVIGKTKFSRSGRSRIRRGSSLRVNMPGVTTASYVIATLQTKRTGVYVAAAVASSGFFTIYLNKSVSSITYIGYLVIN